MTLLDVSLILSAWYKNNNNKKEWLIKWDSDFLNDFRRCRTAAINDWNDMAVGITVLSKTDYKLHIWNCNQ